MNRSDRGQRLVEHHNISLVRVCYNCRMYTLMYVSISMNTSRYTFNIIFMLYRNLWV